jgi:6-phospho-3-hexuloisomerase
MGGINANIRKILEEMSFVLSSVEQSQVDALQDDILKAGKIVVCGAGRVGMAARGFAMRLGHLGFTAYSIGDSTVPVLGRGDLLIAASGSGETQTVYDLVKCAKDNGVRVALITGNPASRMGKIADTVVLLQAPSKTRPIDGFDSVQPMTTLNEQCLWIFFDALVLELMEKKGETKQTMSKRHSNLE